MTRPVTARAKLLLVALASAAVSLTSPGLASADVSGDLTYTNAGDHGAIT